MNFSIWFLIGIIALLNILVSFRIYNSDELDSFQKKGQVVLVWLMPLVASVGIWLFMNSQDKQSSKVSLGSKSNLSSIGNNIDSSD